MKWCSWKGYLEWSIKVSGKLRRESKMPEVSRARGKSRRGGVRALLTMLAFLLASGYISLDKDSQLVLQLAEWVEVYLGAAEYQVVTTDVGQSHRVTLADGTKLVLNTATTIRVRASRSRSEVTLESGEVLIEPPANLEKPVRVITGDYATEIRRGKLSARNMEDGGHTIFVFAGDAVLSGYSQETKRSLRPVYLTTGRSVRIRPAEIRVSRFVPTPDDRLLAWTDGQLRFKGESLASVVAEFNRYNRRKMSIQDPSIGRMKIGGTFTTRGVDHFVAALERNFGVRAVLIQAANANDEEGVIVLTSAKVPVL